MDMGKGHQWRKTDFKNFFNNFDSIKFKKKKDTESKTEAVVKKNKTTYKYN
jgi:hypothetical protein